MTFVVGVGRDGPASGALYLAAKLARSTGEDLVVCTVAPALWPPGIGKVDAEYQEDIDHLVAEAQHDARRLLPADLSVQFAVIHTRSIAAGLLDAVNEHAASRLVIGSAGRSTLGRVAFGGVAHRLLHSSPVPVALAPRGFRCRPDARVQRVTAAFGAGEGSTDLVIASADFATQTGAALRLASFAVRPRTPLTAGIGSRAEAAVAEEWAGDVEKAQRAALDEIARLPKVPHSLDAVVGRGRDWESALEGIDWDDGDVLVVGSSAAGPLERVFLGTRSSKIVRNSVVPVIVVPRGAAEERAERARRPQEDA